MKKTRKKAPRGMKPSELFVIGGHVAKFSEHDPEKAYRGVVISVDDHAWKVLVRDRAGKRKLLAADLLTEIVDPKAKSADAGLPRDPEVWDAHHRMVFLQREHDSLRDREDAARAELATYLQVPATWKFILATIKDRIKPTPKLTGNKRKG
jgi:hypothetical protein